MVPDKTTGVQPAVDPLPHHGPDGRTDVVICLNFRRMLMDGIPVLHARDQSGLILTSGQFGILPSCYIISAFRRRPDGRMEVFMVGSNGCS